MEDKYVRGSRDNWEKIMMKYEELEALRTENRNLKGHHLEYWLPPVPSSYVPMHNCFFG